jgi:hypothetical protein
MAEYMNSKNAAIPAAVQEISSPAVKQKFDLTDGLSELQFFR